MGRLKYIFHCILHMDYKSLFDTVKTVHEVSGKNRIWLFFDIIKCGFKYGAGYKDYLLCAFYDLNDKQRATYVTRGINNSIVKSLNDPAYYHIFDNKSEFYTTFAEYLHREWLHFSKCTKEQFLDFMQDKDEIILNKFSVLTGVVAFIPVWQIYQILLPIGLALGIGIGFIGSMMTTRKHLRV